MQVAGEIVSWDLFPLLGVQPEIGRGFLPEEEAPGTNVAVISHGLWQSRFGGDREILTRRIRVNGKPFRVAGVAPPGFHFPVDNPESELWTTLAVDATIVEFTPLTEQRGARMLDGIGRLKRGVNIDQARAQMDQIAGGLARQYPDDNKNVATTYLAPELGRLTGKSRKPLWILMGAVGLVLLIACANVANLLLARSSERVHEFILRTAVGASRAALARQVLIESLALGVVGSAAGILLGFAMLKVILPLAGESIPRITQTAIDGRVLAFSALLAILTSVLFSVAPAIQVTRSDLAGALKEGARSIARGRNRFRSALIVGQIALGLVLLVGAELLMNSFLQLMHRDPGFRTDHLLTFNVGLPEAQYNTAAQLAFCNRFLERLQAIPGVQAAATGTPLPLTGDQMSMSFDIEERRVAAPDRPHSDMSIVTAGYFHSMQIPILRGRDFGPRDEANVPRVVIVNQAFARRFFPGEEALGKRIEPGATNGKEGTVLREIVGVVGNAKQLALGADADPIYYFPYSQLTWGLGTIVMRTAVPPRQVETAARAALASLDAQAPMYEVRTGDDITARSLAGSRFQMITMSSFAGAALLLTVAGLYGVLSYTVVRRRREIGVRIALGADRSKVLGLVMREAGALVIAGLILGLAGAFGVGRLLESMVYGVRPGAPAVVAGACSVMLIASLVAAYLPASRAASVDPIQALRAE